MALPADNPAIDVGGGRASTSGKQILDKLGLPAALAAALLVILPFVQNVHIAEYDEAVFLDVARNVARTGLPLRSIGAHGIPSLEHTPLYPFLLSLYAPQTGDSLVLARSITAAAGLLAIVLAYKIGVLIRGRAAGFLAAVFAAVSPFLAVYSYFVRMEMFVVVSVLATLYLLVRRRPRSGADLLLAGCTLAIGCLFKEFALVLALPAAVYTWFTTPGPIAQRGRAVLLLVGPPILALAGWAIWAWSLWPAAFVSAIQRWLHSAAGGPITDPRSFVGWGAWSLQLVDDLFRPGLLLGLLAGLAAKVLRGARRITADEALLWGYLLTAVGLSYMLRLREPRHLIAAVPVAAVLAGCGLVSLYRSGLFSSRRTKSGLVIAMLALIMLAGPWQPAAALRGGQAARVLSPTYAARLDNDRSYGPLAQAGAQVGQLAGPGEVVVVAHQGPVVAYYANRHYLMLYTLTEPAVMRALGQARLLVWDPPTWLALPAERAPFVEAQVAAEFELLQQVGEAPQMIRIYQRKP